MPKNKAVNLLPQEEFNVSNTGRVLKWATGTFRIIVIITELVVMGAFLSRFWLDAQNSSLTSSIKLKSAQITAQADLEKEFRNVQSKLNIFNQLSQTHNTSKRVETIISKLPTDVTLSGLTISDTSAQIKGISGTEVGIAQFVANLQEDQTLKKVNIDQIRSADEGSMESVFSINISY